MKIYPRELLVACAESATRIIWLAPDDFASWCATQGAATRIWLDVRCIDASHRGIVWIPADDATHAPRVLLIAEPEACFEAAARAAETLPEGSFEVLGELADPAAAVLGWMLAGYRYTRYKTGKDDCKPVTARPRLVVPENADIERLDALASAIWLTRDLINTPTSDLLPSAFAQLARQVAEQHAADFHETRGDALLDKGLGAIHAVGRASADAPRLIDFIWGDEKHPKLTLVGKGVCFDSGGLNIKTAAGMRLMKKDMGGAALALALGQLIMQRKLPVRLRVLLPMVENAIAGNACRPGDVLTTYKGITVEIGNTDAEGRLILCDALALACEESPELLIDFATLTGAARVALGASLPAMFASDKTLSDDLMCVAEAVDDPVWPLPLHQPYARQIKSPLADINNAGTSPENGAIYAALFLQAFVEQDIDWVHFDLMGWNARARPGYPVGGDAPGLRTVFSYLENRFQS